MKRNKIRVGKSVHWDVHYIERKTLQIIVRQDPHGIGNEVDNIVYYPIMDVMNAIGIPVREELNA